MGWIGVAAVHWLETPSPRAEKGKGELLHELIDLLNARLVHIFTHDIWVVFVVLAMLATAMVLVLIWFKQITAKRESRWRLW